MTELERLVRKHRSNGLLIDSNLFVLYLVGRTNEKRIPQFNRTQQYTIEEFRLLNRLVGQFQTVITTPHVLTEVSNLAKLDGRELPLLRARLQQITQTALEFFEDSRTVMSNSLFSKFGLTDAAIGTLSARPMLVLTDDLPLYAMLASRGVDAINFNHIRSYAW